MDPDSRSFSVFQIGGTDEEQINITLTNAIANLTAIGLNISESDELVERYATNRRLENKYFYTFVLLYGILILFGAIGNILVVSAVVRKQTMRTARNMFIINLAVSDLLLCLITMPLTFIEIMTMYWPFGKHSVFLCKLFGCLQAISIFVSAISITAISVDRFYVIVYPTKRSVQKFGAVMALLVIWLVACLLALPLFIWRKLNHIILTGYESVGLTSLEFCFEDFPIDNGRAYYSIGTMIVQYLFPIITVSLAYSQISKKLRYRMKNNHRNSETYIERGQGKNAARTRRTNALLISIAFIYGISWLPLNVINIIVDLNNPFNDKTTFYVSYAICHAIGMSSACTNPVLYAWLNENFRKEFSEIGLSLKSFFWHKILRRKRKSSGLEGRRDSKSLAVCGEKTEDPNEFVVHYKKSDVHANKKKSFEDCDGEANTLITQVIDRYSK